VLTVEGRLPSWQSGGDHEARSDSRLATWSTQVPFAVLNGPDVDRGGERAGESDLARSASKSGSGNLGSGGSTTDEGSL